MNMTDQKPNPRIRVVDTSESVPAADSNAKIEGLYAGEWILMHDLSAPGRLVFMLPASKVAAEGNK
jgi:hypothetical protein